MSRILVEIDTTDLSTHKDIALLQDAFEPFHNWAVKRVALVKPQHGEIKLNSTLLTRNKKALINLVKYLRFELKFERENIAGIMGVSLNEFNGRLGAYLDEEDQE